MPKRYAVIDLGTNTFHLLIAEATGSGSFTTVFRKREFVKLGIEGLETLGQAPFERGLETMRLFHQLLTEYRAERVRAIGTAALRTATNGPAFLERVLEQTGIRIDLISGDEEAVLIYKGVRQAVRLGARPALIIDIGGGSVEFMLADERTLHWRQSFPVGLAVLYRRFHRHDPILPAEVDRLQAFLEEQLAPLWEQLPVHRPDVLVGAAGAFEIFADFLPHQTITPHQQNFTATDFSYLHRLLAASTLEQRLTMEKLPPQRADLIVVAMELIYFILEKTGIQNIAVSEYAMKEGILSEIMNNEQ